MITQSLQNETFTLPSKLLGRDIPYCTIFPKDYADSDKKIPVLYLLHGLFGRYDNWLTNTKIIEYAAEYSFVIICAEGGDNWYSDGNQFYEKYFFDELFPEVESRFNVGGNKNLRAVAGLSMGGYGAFKFAFRRPEMFCLAAAMSGAFHAADIYENNIWTELQASILNVFGSDESLRSQNNLFQIVENFPSEQVSKLPLFYFDCGTDDTFLPINIALANLFQQRKITHEFKQFSGGHDWDYWNLRLKSILELINNFFKQL